MIQTILTQKSADRVGPGTVRVGVGIGEERAKIREKGMVITGKGNQTLILKMAWFGAMKEVQTQTTSTTPVEST
jgi:hypothetical protein